MRRVAITGIGLVGPTGTGKEAFWQALIEGRSGIGKITRFDPTSYPCQIGGEVKDHSYEDFLDPRILRTTTHATQLALAAAELALRDARMPAEFYDPAAVGVSLGTALGGWRDAEHQYGILLARGARRVNPFLANGAPYHASGVEVASAIGARGTQLTFSSGCPSALQAIGQGALLVASGQLEMCLAGGTESPLTALVVAGMGRTLELATQNDVPGAACRPFDRRHEGIVLSEGACFAVLETVERSRQRGKTPYAEVSGSASSCDASGLYGFDPSGDPGAAAIHAALSRSGLAATDIDYVCAHANSSPTFDRKEAFVLKKAFGECTGRLPVSSIKGVLGHPFGASGAFQVAATALAIEHSTIPPTHNLEDPDPECNLAHVAESPQHAHLRAALITSYGYGGANAYLVLRQPRT